MLIFYLTHSTCIKIILKAKNYWRKRKVILPIKLFKKREVTVAFNLRNDKWSYDADKSCFNLEVIVKIKVCFFFQTKSKYGLVHHLSQRAEAL